MIYEPSNWYWIVGGDTSKAWSSASAGFVDADDETYAAWLQAGTGPTPIASLQALEEVLSVQYPAGMLSTYAADVRWRKEVGGIVVGGVPVATDDRSKQMITGARLAAEANPAWSTSWVGSDGNVYPVDAATIIVISDAVQEHVNECFETFASIAAGIANETITTREQIDAAFAA
jgi:hypothetical protein